MQVEEERIEKLADFQEAALRQALRFPAVRRVVYSTCSVHARENEAVVAAVLPQAAHLGFLLQVRPSCHQHLRNHVCSTFGLLGLVGCMNLSGVCSPSWSV